MKLAVFSHKECWRSRRSPTGYATDGGFAFQMGALSELFDETVIAAPVLKEHRLEGEVPFRGKRLRLAPLTRPQGHGFRRKLALAPWMFRNGLVLVRALLRADAVHCPIPGDIGTIGLLLAWTLRKPLFVRHCGDWARPATAAEKFWIWFMERAAGGRNVMLATGGSDRRPSARNPNLRWIFSTSLTRRELDLACRRTNSTPSGEFRLIIVCRQEVLKGTGVVIESLKLLRNQFPNLRLDVVGDGSALPVFRRMAQALNLEELVTFWGKLDHAGVIERLRKAHLFCYPTSASEGFPKVVLEALAYGLPVITTPISVLPRLVSAGGGVLLDEAKPEVLAAAIRDCLSDQDRYRRLSAQASRTAGEFSLECWRDTIGGLLEQAWGPLRRDDQQLAA